MSEKITFQELVESIAEETDNSKQFTQDFIKDFVEVINDGLEEDGSVNIAGFGKFNLRRVDEREGYNPQTEEKITIPAHNKLIFKPYKNLRELVNAPYAHQEPELIKEDEGENDEDTIEEGSTDPKETGDQSDFIPTGPPTSTESSEEAEEEIDAENEDIPFVFDDEEEDEKKKKEQKQKSEDDSSPSEDPFAFDSEESSEEKDDEDIVEFNADQNTGKDSEDEIDEELDKFFGDQDQSEEEDDGVEETLEQTEELINESDEFLESVENEDEDKNEHEEAPVASPSVNQPRSAKSKNSVNPVIMIVAACILLLAGVGAWYYSLVSDSSQQEMQSQEMITATSDKTEENQQDQSADNQNNQQSQQTADSDQNQPQDPGSSTSTAATTTGSQDKGNEEIEIEKGQTLWSLAEEKYGNPRLWPWIYGTNESVENPDLIYAGNSLSVPLPSGPNNSLNDADSVGVAKGYLATYRWYKDNDSSKAKNHLLGAKLYHDDIRNIADVKIDKADLSYANQVR